MRVGFVGLGNMGHFMAANLQKAGHELTVNDLRPETAAELVDNGATWADSPRSTASGAEAVFLSLPGPPDVETVVSGEDGILDAMAAGSTIVDLSTNSPSMVRKLAELAEAKGVGFLDAPVSGGTRGARDATLAVMVGGDADLYARFEPVLKAIGPNVFNTGPVGTGNVAKLINNQLAFINMMAMNEALLMGGKAGIDLVMLRDIVRSSSGDSFPWAGGAQAVLKDRLPPRFTTTLACKDIGLAPGAG
jgi:3-hydroxyisobutyrate dehydrogenase-like beta-hydroxyacid dehydrogenase